MTVLAAGFGCDLPGVNTVCDVVGGAVGGAASGAADSALGRVQDWIADGVGGLVGMMVQMADQAVRDATEPELTADWFVRQYNLVFGIAVTVAVLTFTLGVLNGLVKGEPKVMAKAFTGTGSGVLLSFVVLAIGQTLLQASSAIAGGIVSSSGTNMTSMFQDIWNVSAAATAATGGTGAWLMSLLMAIVFAIATVFFWIVMFLRMVGIYVLAVFAPLALVGLGWDRTREWGRRWAEIMLALILSPIAMAIVFSLGFAMVGQEGGEPAPSGVDVGEYASDPSMLTGLNTMLAGCAILFLAGFAPWALYKFISFAGNSGEDSAAFESPRGIVGGPAMAAGVGAMAVGGQVSSVLGRAGGGGGGGDEGGGGGGSMSPTMAAGGDAGGAAGGGAAGGAAGGSAGGGAAAAGGGGAAAGAATGGAAVVAGAGVDAARGVYGAARSGADAVGAGADPEAHGPSSSGGPSSGGGSSSSGSGSGSVGRSAGERAAGEPE